MKILFLLILLVALLVVNIYFYVRRKQTPLSIGMHIASFFGGIFIFCLLMDTAILDLHFEKYYKGAGFYVMSLSLAACMITFEAYIRNKRKSKMKMYIPPDLYAAFMSIEDMAVICDYKGNIIEINQSKRGKMLFGEMCTTIEDITSLLLINTPQSDHFAIKSAFKDLKVNHQFEINITRSNDFFLVTTSPIMADRKNCIGVSIVFYDITKEKRLVNEINHNNLSLQNANKKLIDYVKIANVLEAEKERLSLLQNVQSDLVDKIESVIANIKNIQMTQYDTLEDYQRSMGSIAKELREVYKDVRKSIHNISGMKKGG